MKHKVKLTVIDKKCHPELQEKFCTDRWMCMPRRAARCGTSTGCSNGR